MSSVLHLSTQVSALYSPWGTIPRVVRRKSVLRAMCCISKQIYLLRYRAENYTLKVDFKQKGGHLKFVIFELWSAAIIVTVILLSSGLWQFFYKLRMLIVSQSRIFKRNCLRNLLRSSKLFLKGLGYVWHQHKDLS